MLMPTDIIEAQPHHLIYFIKGSMALKKHYHHLLQKRRTSNVAMNGKWCPRFACAEDWRLSLVCLPYMRTSKMEGVKPISQLWIHLHIAQGYPRGTHYMLNNSELQQQSQKCVCGGGGGVGLCITSLYRTRSGDHLQPWRPVYF